MATTAADRGRDVRRRLLAAAVELIPRLGWGAVSTRLLAEHAGVAPGLVHYHFESLPALLRQAALGVMRELLAGTEATLADAPDVAAGFELMMGSLDAYTGTDPASLLFVETYLAATRDEALRTELAGLLGEFRGTVAGWLERHRVPLPGGTAAVFAAAIDGVMLHRPLDPALTSAAVSPVLRRLLDDRLLDDRLLDNR